MTLKVLILSRIAGSYSTQRLKEACLRRGHSARVLNTLNFSLLVERAQPRLFYRDRLLSQYDAAIPRIGASVSSYGTAVVRQLEQMGVFTLNSAQAILTSRDKLRAFQILSAHEIAFPPTAFVRDRESARSALSQVGGAPVIIKLTEGSQGAGVILADTKKSAESIIEAFLVARQDVIVQKFVSESRGRDLRVLVVGGRVVAAMRRRAAPDEFRSNVHRGGRTERARLSPELEALALKSAQILGLQVAGVDLIESDDGPLVLEVNSSPGLEGIENATGIDVAGTIVEHLEQQIAFPELDLRQRLGAAPTHVTAELVIGPNSPFEQRALGALDLQSGEILVLTVTRGTRVIPTPGREFQLYRGDRLLCFGRAEALRALMAEPPAGAARPSSESDVTGSLRAP